LESQNYEFDFAENGVVAVEKQRARPYDLILMDVQMPEKDGYSATREIRSWEAENSMSRIPIVALTAHALKGEEMRSREAGCSAFLSKPIQKAKLINEIERHLNPTRPPRKLESELRCSPEIRARVPIYLARRREDVRTIETLLSEGDFDKIRVLAHNMKGSGTGYGFPEITELGASIEKAAKSLDKAAVSEQTGSLDALVSALHSAAVPKT
jgi:CheY-like chemotaxis protein/HPt (histidine-containing phosphotransfer) domain-containing protein